MKPQYRDPNKRFLLYGSGAALIVIGMLLGGAGVDRARADQNGSSAPYAATDQWLQPGSGNTLPAVANYEDESGKLGVLNTSGLVETKSHPFFTPLGTNGRACVTCHQPADAMSISVRTIRARWDATKGRDPLFAPVDGSNCPDLPQDQESSHSLLLNRGLLRVFLPWPPRAADGSSVKPEFTIEVIRDPTGCNNSAQYGLHSPTPLISVYRRPRVAANAKYFTFSAGVFSPKQLAMPMGTDPDTGKPVGMNMMADARALTHARR